MAKKEKIKSLFDNIAPDYDKLKSVIRLSHSVYAVCM